MQCIGKIKSMAVTKNSAAYWEGNCEAETLQRIYGEERIQTTGSSCHS